MQKPLSFLLRRRGKCSRESNKKSLRSYIVPKAIYWRTMKTKIMKALGILMLFGVCYFAGAAVAQLRAEDKSQSAASDAVVLQSQDWGLGFSEEGKPPTGMASVEELAKTQTYFLGDTTQKKIYLTFDCGYENGNTEPILAALKKHGAKATFFVVGHYLESAPELVKKMVEEGHTVGNHTYHHYDMSKIADKDSFAKEISNVEEKYKEITGQEMIKYYRPPQGKYSQENLKMAKELGYHTFFWSLAYVDWNQDAQPTHEEAFEKLMGRVHPGAIVLLHNTSSTNGEILDELLSKWEEEGYTFGTLDEVI